ncbi:MAG: hypothetical protein FJY37_09470 [Betaproteobacteria bacterium]|nr:hypothetical protein [Betaproteobacteria bacterium]
MRRLLALATFLALALAAPESFAQRVTFSCDERADQWDKKIIACPGPGKAYPQDAAGWKDGVVVELSGFSYSQSNGSPTTKIDSHWFTEDGQPLRGKTALISPLVPPARDQVNPGLVIGVNGAFQGLLQTQPSHIIAPGRYKVLFRATFLCGEERSNPLSRYPGRCSREIIPTQLPAGFNVMPGVDDTRLVYEGPWGFSEYAWAAIEVLPDKRPEPQFVGQLICVHTVGQTCLARSRFYFDSGLNRHLAKNRGCVKMYRKDVPGTYPFPAQLRDQNGRLVSGAEFYQLTGFGTMPGAGTWEARLECLDAPPVKLGEYVLNEEPKPVPDRPAAPDTIQVTLSPVKPSTQDPNFSRPGIGEIYVGDWLIARLPPEVTTVSKVDIGMNLAGSQSESFCHLRLRNVQTPAVDRYLVEGSVRFAGTIYPLGSPGPPIAVEAKLPNDIGPGRYSIELSCPMASYQNRSEIRYGPLLARSPYEFEIKAPRRPKALLKTTSARAPSGNPLVDGLWRCTLCNGDFYTLTISGLQAGDTLVEARWGVRREFGCSPRNASCQDAFPIVGYERAASGGVITLSGKIPEGTDGDFNSRHSLQIVLRDADGRTYMIPGSDIAVYPLPKNGEDLAGGFNFYRPCAGFDNRTQPLIDIDPVVDLSGEGLLKLSARGFECLSDIAIRMEAREPAPLADQIGLVKADGAGTVSARLPLTTLLRAEWQRQVRAPVTAKVIVSSSTGRSVIANVQLLPPTAITVTPDQPNVGESIAVAWKGFSGSATLYIDGGVLKDQIYLEKADPVIRVRLPDALTGPRVLRLVDVYGKWAEARIRIAGEGGASKVCVKPCLYAPPTARQGDEILVRYGGFTRTAAVAFFLNGFEFRTAYQGTLLDSIRLRIPAGLKDGSYVLSARSGEQFAQATIIVGGNRRIALAARPVNAGDDPVRYVAGTHSVHVKGNGWYPKGNFSAKLIGVDANRPDGVDHQRLYELVGFTNGCASFVGPHKAYGKPCDDNTGEIDQFWSLDANVAAGQYVLTLSDGLSEGVTENVFVVGVAPPQPDPTPQAKGELAPAKALPGATVTFSGAGFPPGAELAARFDGQPLAIQGATRAGADGKVAGLRFAVPRNAAPGEHLVMLRATPAQNARSAQSAARSADAVELRHTFTVLQPEPLAGPQAGPQPAPQPVAESKPKPAPVSNPPETGPSVGRTCDPSLRKFWQPGCVDGPQAGPQPAPQPVVQSKPKPAPVSNPPEMKPAPPATPVAAPAPPAPKPPVTQVAVCDSKRPRYAQPGCVEPASAPGTGAGAPQKCNSSIPRYAQPDCTP